MSKNKIINIKGTKITIIRQGDSDYDYISLTDMLKAKDGDFFISDWLRNRNTVEFLGIWERIYNPNFNYGEFAIIKSKAGLNNYKISAKEWVEKGFDSYVQTYNFNDKQIQILRDMKDIVSANITEKKKMSVQEIFNNPFYSRTIGRDYQEVNKTFDNRFSQVFEELQSTFKV
ncbi:MAG: KilA-N domain-containing protein [bacterium]|nr:KilA-N domain-containing protein [bacterium]